MLLYCRPAGCHQPAGPDASGECAYTLKSPYRDGTTHIILDPLDFIVSLAAQVARPRVNLTRFHGVCLPPIANTGQARQTDPDQINSPAQCDAAMTWAQSLK